MFDYDANNQVALSGRAELANDILKRAHETKGQFPVLDVRGMSTIFQLS